MQGGHKISVRFNQRCVFCKDRGINFFFWSRCEYDAFGGLHFTARWMEKGHFPTLQTRSKTELFVRALQQIKSNERK
jgi:hypothetical protein